MAKTFERIVRRPRSYTSSLLINQVSLRRPFVVMWYTAMLPGFGMMMLCKYVNGMLMMLLELLLNTKSHLNTAIYDSMIGRVGEATKVLDTRWFLAYTAVYVFVLRNVYVECVTLNKGALLADREDSPILPTRISAFEINTLDLRNPREAAFWSFLCPGFGHLYIGRFPSGFFLVAWYLLTVYMSNMLPAVLATFHGNLSSASSLLNPQWLLYLPSLACFAANDAYLQCNGLNQAFKSEQTKFFRSQWQIGSLDLP